MKRALLILMCGLPAVVAAQVPAVPIGARIRVESSELGRVQGTLIAQTADSLIVQGSNGWRMPVSAASVHRVSTSPGRSHGRGAVKGLGYGALVAGGGLGTMALLSSEPEWAPLVAVVFGFYGGMIGAGVGALIGSEQWSEVRAAFPRVTAQAAPGQIRGLGLAVRF